MALGPFSLAVLLNLTATSTCNTIDLEYFVKGLVQCTQDRFGANCDYRFSKSREYLPLIYNYINPNEKDVELVLHRRKCTSAWFQNWLCSLPSEEKDLSGITVGKTILQRVVKNYESTMNRRKNPKRSIFSIKYLEKWKWRPLDNNACHFKGTDFGSSKPEAWLVSDVCVSQEVSKTIPVSESFLKLGEEIVRSAVHTSVKLDDWVQGHSVASLWWAGQLTVASLASFGRCSLLSARSLKPNTLYSNTINDYKDQNMHDMKLNYMNNKLLNKFNSRKSQQPPQQRLAIAMHIRRGDSCMRWATSFGDSSLKNGRPCFKTDLYIKAALMIQKRYGKHMISHVNLATDSANASKTVSDLLQREGFSVTTLLYDRLNVGGNDMVNKGKLVDQDTLYIEDRLKLSLNNLKTNTATSTSNEETQINPELVIGSLAAELELLSQSQFLIGTSSSWVTRLTFLAMIGRQGIIPPFIFVDSPFGCLNIKTCAI